MYSPAGEFFLKRTEPFIPWVGIANLKELGTLWAGPNS